MSNNKRERRYSIRESGSQYPQPWSDWTWDRDNRYWWSRREVAFNQFEHEYQDKDHNPITVTSTSTRIRPASTSTRPSGSTEQFQDQYTTDRDPVSHLSDVVERTSLESAPLPELSQNHPPAQAHVTTKYPRERSEEFDPNYKAHKAWEFKWGRVFKILWSEPSGNDDKGGTVISERLGRWGQKFTEKVRRFVIIDNRKGHCICLPIMTYGGQGCLKRGVHAGDHAIIYTTSQPARFAGEDGMTKKPIKVKQYSPQHKLEAASRLNYAKVYTIEYNVKVWFIGEIRKPIPCRATQPLDRRVSSETDPNVFTDKDSEWWLTAAYNEAHPPLKPRGIPPSFPPRGSSVGYPASSSTTPLFPEQHPQNIIGGTFGSQSSFTSADNSLYPTWQQRESSMHNPGRMQDYPSARMQDTRNFSRVATSDWRLVPSSERPRADSYGEPESAAEGSSSQLTTTGSRADYPRRDSDRDYQEFSLPQERYSNQRRFEDDDLYEA